MSFGGVAMNVEEKSAQLVARLERLPFSQWHRHFFILAFFGIALDAADFALFGAALPPIAREFGLGPAQSGLLATVGLFGAFLGALFWGTISDYIGRRTAFQATVGLFAVFTGLVAVSWNIMSLGVFRFLSNFGLGGEVPVTLTLSSEFSPGRIRGSMAGNINFIITDANVLPLDVSKLIHEALDPYANPELAGKAAVFAVTVHDVKERELPPLDDEFATRVSTSKTLEDLRADVKRRLDETVKGNARRRMSSELLDKIVALNDVPLPAVLVEREIDSLIADMQQYIARAGIGWDDYLAQAGKTADEVREGYRGEAERRVKTTLLVEAIAKKEGIAATQADVEAELDALAAQYGQPRARIIEALQSNVGALVDGIVGMPSVSPQLKLHRPRSGRARWDT